jgi:DegV family protein with EDD domain
MFLTARSNYPMPVHSTRPSGKILVQFQSKFASKEGTMIIVTDSGADLTQQDIETLGIEVAPLQIKFPEGEVESESISRDDFYSRLRAMWPMIPSTSQPSAGVFADLYRKLAGRGEEIFSVHISSGLSGTLNSAILGAKDVLDATVQHWDTMTLSGGERFQVLAAALMSKAGRSKEAITERLEQIRANTEVIYTLETLAYLAKGGRIGRVQALAGMLLQIKPVINVDKTDGKYSTVGKERTMQKSMALIANYLEKRYGTTELWVSVVHGQVQEQADQLARMLQERLTIGKLETLRISPVLGVHTGPGIVGATVVPVELMQDW